MKEYEHHILIDDQLSRDKYLVEHYAETQKRKMAEAVVSLCMDGKPHVISLRYTMRDDPSRCAVMGILNMQEKPLVRCKDCKWKDRVMLPTKIKCLRVFDEEIDDNNYCSFGEPI